MPQTTTRPSVGLAKYSLLRLARLEITRALHTTDGMSLRTLPEPWGPGSSVLALRAGSGMSLRAEPGWTLHVVQGRVRVRHERVVAVGYPGDVLCGRTAATVTAVADSGLLVWSEPDAVLGGLA